MKTLIIAFGLMVLTVSAQAQEDSQALCGALTQIQNNRVDEIVNIEKQLLQELSKKEQGKGDASKIFDLSDRLDTLRVEVRQLDADLEQNCH